MPDSHEITPAESGAFARMLKIEPTESGPLDGLCFVVKDLIDVQGYVTGCGNPDSLRSYYPRTLFPYLHRLYRTSTSSHVAPGECQGCPRWAVVCGRLWPRCFSA